MLFVLPLDLLRGPLAWHEVRNLAIHSVSESHFCAEMGLVFEEIAIVRTW